MEDGMTIPGRLTRVKRALLGCLKDSQLLTTWTSGRIAVNSYQDMFFYELPFIRMFAESEEKIDNDYSPRRDERKLTFTVELLSPLSADLLEEMAEEVDKCFTVAKFNEFLENYDDIKFWSVAWTRSEIAAFENGERELMAFGLEFELEYQCFRRFDPLPDFTTAQTEWTAKFPGGELPAEDTTEMET